MYLLGTSKTVNVQASKENTVDELIRHVFSLCSNPQDSGENVCLPYGIHEGTFAVLPSC
ncbi:MAG: hypothetical protein P4M11_07090 [Candidatus Pacebacteria bacterium]|nr:hypothetical protein [Candidatus Paceibacterota bacterium]